MPQWVKAANLAYIPAFILTFTLAWCLHPWVPGSQGQYGFWWFYIGVAMGWAGLIWLSSRISRSAMLTAILAPLVIMLLWLTVLWVIRHTIGHTIWLSIMTGLTPFVVATLYPVINNHVEIRHRARTGHQAASETVTSPVTP